MARADPTDSRRLMRDDAVLRDTPDEAAAQLRRWLTVVNRPRREPVADSAAH